MVSYDKDRAEALLQRLAETVDRSESPAEARARDARDLIRELRDLVGLLGDEGPPPSDPRDRLRCESDGSGGIVIYRRSRFHDSYPLGVEVSFDAETGEFQLAGWRDGETTALALGYDRFERRFYAGDQSPQTAEEWRRADPLVALVKSVWDAMVTHQQSKSQ